MVHKVKNYIYGRFIRRGQGDINCFDYLSCISGRFWGYRHPTQQTTKHSISPIPNIQHQPSTSNIIETTSTNNQHIVARCQDEVALLPVVEEGVEVDVVRLVAVVAIQILAVGVGEEEDVEINEEIMMHQEVVEGAGVAIAAAEEVVAVAVAKTKRQQQNKNASRPNANERKRRRHVSPPKGQRQNANIARNWNDVPNSKINMMHRSNRPYRHWNFTRLHHDNTLNYVHNYHQYQLVMTNHHHRWKMPGVNLNHPRRN